MLCRTVAIGLVFLSQTTAIMFAQARTEDPRADSKVHVGIFYLQPSIDLKELGVDTNVFNEPENGKKDFTFTVAPQLTTSIPFASRGLVQLLTSADLIYYQKHDSERSVNPNVNVRAELYFNRLTIYAEPSYLRTRARPNLEIDKRSLRVEQGTLAGGELRVASKIAVETSIQHMRTTYDADEFFMGTNLAQVLNRNNVTLTGAVRWLWTPLTTFVAKADVATDRFLLAPVRDANSTSVLGGVELKPRALISGTGYVGVRKFTSIDAATPDFTGTVAAATLRYSIMGSTVLGLNVDRDVHYSFEPEQPYYVGTGWGARLQRHIIGRFDAEVGLERFRSSYRRRVTTEDVVNDVQVAEITKSYNGSIGYRVGQSGRFAVGLSYWNRDSNRNELRDYRGLRFRSTLTYGL